MTLVLVAFACVPDRGSEPGAGWAAARAANAWGVSRDADVTVVTRGIWRDAIESGLRGDPLSVTWRYHDLPRVIVFLCGGASSRLYFAAWQLSLLVFLRRKLSSSRAVHLVTYATDSVPPVSLLLTPRRKGRIWGPLGSVRVAWRQGAANRVVDIWKSLVLNRATRRIGYLLLQNSAVSSRLSRPHCRVYVRPNIVVEANAGGELPIKEFQTQILSVGNLVPGKRVDLAVALMLRLPESVGLVIIGDGPLRKSLEDLGEEMGIGHRVSFKGALPHAEVLNYMRASDLLVHLSEHESAGWVVGEALAVGTPPLVFHGSGADSVLRLTGHLGGVVMVNEMDKIAERAQSILATGRGAPTDQWSWEAFKSYMFQLYDDAIADR